MIVEERLEKLGLELPTPPPPAANYDPFVQIGSLIFISGQLPFVDGSLKYVGHVGAELSTEEGYEAAKICALNGLAQMKKATGSFDRLDQIVRVDGFVSSAPGWTDHPTVVNGCSDLLKQLLKERAGHARIAVGSNELPLNAAVEIAFIIAVKDEEAEDS